MLRVSPDQQAYYDGYGGQRDRYVNIEQQSKLLGDKRGIFNQISSLIQKQVTETSYEDYKKRNFCNFFSYKMYLLKLFG